MTPDDPIAATFFEHSLVARVATRSPTATRVTPGPTASTTPQPSENGVIVPPAVAEPRLYMPFTISMSR